MRSGQLSAATLAARCLFVVSRGGSGGRSYLQVLLDSSASRALDPEQLLTRATLGTLTETITGQKLLEWSLDVLDRNSD